MIGECESPISDEQASGGNSCELPGYLHHKLGTQADIRHAICKCNACTLNKPTGAGFLYFTGKEDVSSETILHI